MKLAAFIPGVAQLKTVWRFAPFIAIAAAAVWIVLLMADVRHWRAQYDKHVALRKSDVAEVRLATADAHIAAGVRLLVEERKRTRITQETADAYRTRLAGLDARYDRLWADRNRVRGGQAIAAPALSAAAVRFDDAACGNGLFCISAADAFAILREADRNTAQLIALQGWVAAQAAVDPNAEPDKGEPR